MTASVRVPSSFRDPAGFVFERDGAVFRQVNEPGRPGYDGLMGSGLYDDLAGAGLLVPHVEVEDEPGPVAGAYKVLRPEPVPFLSYPYEWAFSQLRAAALLTLEVQARALAAGLSLKDASAYNVQFRGTRPVFIDTLSFEPYREGEPWAAYRQFCQHFLAPLALWAKVDARLSLLLRPHLDGVPLDLAARLLPARTRLSPGLLLHVHLHARFQRRFADRPDAALRGPKSARFSRRSMLGLIDSLRGTVRSLDWDPKGPWAGYAEDNSYSDAARGRKHALVGAFLDEARPATAWDLGANTGEYSRLAADRGARTVAVDGDPACVERHYRAAVARDDERVLPLHVDLTNPSPALGWQNRERRSLLERGPADAVLALALVHHLAIAHNIPLPQVAEFLARAGRWLVIEFVPKDDPQARRLLAARPDIFPDYHRDGFEAAFAPRFEALRAEPVEDGGRVLYLMRRRDTP